MSAEELVRACAESGESAAWDEFVCRFNRPIALSVIRVAYQWGEAPREVVDDLVQDIYLKLCTDKCRLLLEFCRRQPDAVLGYIKTIAANAAHDHFKSLYSQKRGSGQAHKPLEDASSEAPGSVSGSPVVMEQEILLSQIDEFLPCCSPEHDRARDRLIFWLYYRQGMTAKAIAAMPAVALSAKGVESVIVRLTRLLRHYIVETRGNAGRREDGSGEKGFRRAESY
jgi:RNA polymerase sigma-70 factor, ECF subfamily